MSTATLEKPTETKPSPEPTTGKKYKFKLLLGQYVSTTYTYSKDEDGNKIRELVNKIYQADKRKGHFPIIETDLDLEAMYNGASPNMRKFERVYGETPVTMIDPTLRAPGETIHAYLTRMEDMTKVMKERANTTLKALDTMTIEELVKVAEMEEIDISGAKNPDDARKAIKTALKGTQK